MRGRAKRLCWNLTIPFALGAIPAAILLIGDPSTFAARLALAALLPVVCLAAWFFAPSPPETPADGADCLYRALVNGVPAVLFVARADTHGSVEFMSGEVERQLGFPPEEWTRDPGFWLSRVDPADRERIAAELGAAAATGGSFSSEYRLLGRDGSPRWFRDQRTSVKHAPGPVTRWHGWLTDITGRKALEEQFLQAQKMDAVGRLAGGVAHDFNNLLTVINGYSDLLGTTYPLTEDQRAQIAEISQAGEKGAALTRQLLAFSRKTPPQPVAISLEELVRRSESMIRRLLGERIAVVVDAPPIAGSILADPGQVEQVLLNLAVNARDAMPAGGKLTLRIGEIAVDESSAAAIPGARAGAHIELEVADTGIGMDAATLARIFEPFFTTKDPGQGTGLGLATVQSIVSKAGGHVTVDTRPGRGSRFRVRFPRHHGTASPRPRTPPPAPVQGIGPVMVLEDEGALRALLAAVLRSHGCRVHEARDGREALKLSEGMSEPLALLVTDAVLPDMKGLDVAVRFWQRWPGLGTILMSGYVDFTPQPGRIPASANFDFLQKPFGVEEFTKRVRAILERRTAGAGASPRPPSRPA